jgi:hypothetical protein
MKRTVLALAAVAALAFSATAFSPHDNAAADHQAGVHSLDLAALPDANPPMPAMIDIVVIATGNELETPIFAVEPRLRPTFAVVRDTFAKRAQVAVIGRPEVGRMPLRA